MKRRLSINIVTLINFCVVVRINSQVLMKLPNTKVPAMHVPWHIVSQRVDVYWLSFVTFKIWVLRKNIFTPLHFIFLPKSVRVYTYVLDANVYACKHTLGHADALCLCVSVCGCVTGRGVYVCEYCMHIKKQLGWIRSCTCGNTLSRNSFHEIHNEAGLSSDVAPLLASHRLQRVCCVCVCVCERAEKELLHLTPRSSLHFIPLKNTQKPLTGCGELRTGCRV